MNRQLLWWAALAAVVAFAACSGGPGSMGGLDGGGGGGSGGAGGSDAGDLDGGVDGGNFTWHRDVEPIVRQNCQMCHTTGGIAPFPLLSYADAEAKHLLMASAVSTRFMPPWLPSDACGVPIRDSRRLEQSEIDTLVGWSASGAPEGDPADAPPVVDAGTRALPWVDATLDPGADYTPQSAGHDDYRCFALGSALTASRDVIGFDLEPGVRKQVHHVIVFAAPEADVANADGAAAGLGWPCYGGPGISASATTLVGGWAPGSPPVSYPANTGVRVPSGQQFLMQIHYNLDNSGGQGAPDRTKVKLQYAGSPVAKPAQILPVVNTSFTIPAADGGTPGTVEVTGSTTSPVNVRLWGVFPHMHQLGTKIRVEYGSANACYVDIPRWDFHWQQMYLFEQGQYVPAGTQVRVRCAWSNPTNQPVRWGEDSTEEMCLSYMYLTAP